jgi:hypothetical protein
VYEHLFKTWFNFAILFPKNAIFRSEFSPNLTQNYCWVPHIIFMVLNQVYLNAHSVKKRKLFNHIEVKTPSLTCILEAAILKHTLWYFINLNSHNSLRIIIAFRMSHIVEYYTLEIKCLKMILKIYFFNLLFFLAACKSLIECKTKTIRILTHQMRISTIKVFSVMLRSKKLEIRKINCVNCKRAGEQTIPNTVSWNWANP